LAMAAVAAGMLTVPAVPHRCPPGKRAGAGSSTTSAVTTGPGGPCAASTSRSPRQRKPTQGRPRYASCGSGPACAPATSAGTKDPHTGDLRPCTSCFPADTPTVKGSVLHEAHHAH
jgi:hypothetical protein